MAFKPSPELTVKNILSRISEYDIFKTYCTNFQQIDKLFLSELRNDHKPTCKIFVNPRENNLMYIDFAAESYNCFGYIQAKYGVGFNDALNIINRDFNLGLHITWSKKEIITNIIGEHKYKKVIERNNYNKISKKRRNWLQEDINYWIQYNISTNTLEYFEVQPLEYYWINYNRFKCDTITYSYEFGSGFRDIYSPLDLERKWPCSNTKADKHIYGLKQLPKYGDLLFIVSSLKEVMFLYELGINAIAPQSESTFIPEIILEDLKTRFKEIIILFDFDKAGCIHSLKHSMKSKLKRLKLCPIMISYYQGKDLTDAYVKDNNKILAFLNNYKKYL